MSSKTGLFAVLLVLVCVISTGQSCSNTADPVHSIMQSSMNRHLWPLQVLSILPSITGKKRQLYEKMNNEITRKQRMFEAQMKKAEAAAKENDAKRRAEEEELKRLQKLRKEMEIEALKKRSTSIKNDINTIKFFQEKVKESNEHVLNEIILIKDWESKLSELVTYIDEADSFYWVLENDLDAFEETGMDVAFAKLKESCQNYIDYRIPKDFKDI